MFDVKKINELAKKDYEKAWIETAKLIPKSGRNIEFKGKGKSHVVNDLIEKMRRIFLSLGFEEVINKTIVEESEVYKQYGPEAPIILDRCFYLAGLPRADIGISKDREAEIRKIAPEIDIRELKKVFRAYKKGEIEADDLIEEMVKRLKVREEQASAVLALFPEFRELKPIPTKLILRSHMTSAWFETIASMLKRKPLPLKLFSIGVKFRREQRLDATHLYESTTASLVVVNDKLSLEDGKELTRIILRKLGFHEFEIRVKEVTSKYYAPGTEFEVFVKHGNELIEIADGGFYSPVSLAKYNIPYLVFNLGFGVERIAMILEGAKDIRELVYPQFYSEVKFSDEEIARAIYFIKEPRTRAGKILAEKIKKEILKHRDNIGPAKFFVGSLNNVKVFITEPEAGKKLLGPAGMNEIYVYRGQIIGIDPRDEKYREIKENGVKVCSYLDAISLYFAALAEDGKIGKHAIKIVDTLPSINLDVKEPVKSYLLSKRKSFMVKGPVFIDVEIVRE